MEMGCDESSCCSPDRKCCVLVDKAARDPSGGSDQPTHGRPNGKGLRANGRARVYFNEDRQGSLDIAQVSVKGGPVATIPTEVLSPAIAGISPDALSLLVLQGGTPVPRPVWEVPLPAGQPRRVSNLEAHEASVTPDGRLLLCNVTNLVIAEKDGSNPRIGPCGAAALMEVIAYNSPFPPR